ncbi:MAG: nitroreductase family protein [Alcanivoracaceae bacterium]|nr:nitroreductase family protein [Alcanivoracaceae bacterium]
MNYIDAFNWRYAAKHMKAEAVEQVRVDRICEAARLTPSSFGLQPYVLLQLHDSQQRRQLFEGPAPQPQVVECSHLLVLATRTTIDHALVDRFIRLTAKTRGLSVGDLHGYSQAIKGTLDGFDSEQEKQDWARCQAYIAMGFVMAAAALEQVDASPMEGFDPVALDEMLGLNNEGLRSVALIALGYRDEARDYLAASAKVRWPQREFMPRFRETGAAPVEGRR